MTYKDELTKRQQTQIKNIVKKECANYEKYYDECLALGTKCYMFGKVYLQSGICKYFQNAVLPLHKELEELLLQKQKSNQKICDICNKSFLAKHREKYCSQPCKKEGNRKKSRERMKKMREDKA